MNIPTNLKLIESGNIPTTSNLLKGEMAFGKVPLSGDIRLFVNDSNSVSELLLNKHNNLLGRDANDCHPIDAITGLRDLVNIIDVFYGVEWDTTIANPACRRIGNSLLHQTLPIHSKMRRCLLLDDGTVNYYLDANDSTLKEDGTPAILDGTDGQVMVEIPEHWRKYEVQGTKRRVLLSEYCLPAFHFVPKTYRSAYEAAIDRTNSGAPKLASVVNTTTQFRGGNNTSTWDIETRSLLGMPGTSTSLTNYRTYARRRGIAGKNDAGWNCDVYDIQKTCHWLYIVEYANLNCQIAYNATSTPQGYKQGGLGDGVTTLNSSLWSSWNNYNPFILCGITNNLGNQTGTVDFVMPAEYGAVLTVKVPSYRGIENPFGHLWSWVDGILVNKSGSGATYSSQAFVCEDPSKFSSTITGDYNLIGELPNQTSNYIREMMVGENMPLVIGNGATSTTFWSDYYYEDLVVGLRGVHFGGAANYGASAGFGCSSTYYAPSNTHALIGSRLCFIPE